MAVKKLGLGELRALSRTGQVLLAARCALRVEVWRTSPAVRKAAANVSWDEALAFVVAGAQSQANADAATKLSQALLEQTFGAPDDLAHQTFAYTAQVLSRAVDASAQPDPRKLVIEAGMYAKSIPAMLFHAGKIDALDPAMQSMWDAMRDDIPVLAESSKLTTVAALRRLPLWRKTPSWATPL